MDDLAPTNSIEKCIKLLPPKAKIGGIGCGSRRDAKLNAPLAEFQLMDIETMNLPAASFDGAWAACSLGHISKKIFSNVIKKVHFLLKEKGCFYLTLKKGTGEILDQDLRYGGDIKKCCVFCADT